MARAIIALIVFLALSGCSSPLHIDASAELHVDPDGHHGHPTPIE